MYQNQAGTVVSKGRGSGLLKNLEDYGYIDHAAHIIIKAAVSDRALSGVEPQHRDEIRADIFKHTLTALL